MSLPRNKLERNKQNEISARWEDNFRLVQFEGRDWIVLQDQNGDDVLRIYSVTEKQMAELHAQIGQRLRLAPAATIEYLRQMHGMLEEILKRDEAEQRAAFDQAFGYVATDQPPHEPDPQPETKKRKPRKSQVSEGSV